VVGFLHLPTYLHLPPPCHACCTACCHTFCPLTLPTLLPCPPAWKDGSLLWHSAWLLPWLRTTCTASSLPHLLPALILPLPLKN